MCVDSVMMMMMAPTLKVDGRPNHDQLLISVSSEDEGTLLNQNQDSSDKTPNR